MNVYRFLTVMVCLFLVGCGSGTSSRFYRLTPVQTPVAGEHLSGDLSLAVGPVVFPRYLDRPQIVTGNGPRMRLLEFDQWAGSLRDDFTRALAENLATTLGTDRVTLFPVKRGIPAEYRVSVNVVRLGGEPGKSAVLSARWNVFANSGGELVRMGRTNVEVDVEGPGVGDLVTAQSLAVLRLAEDIAKVIRKQN